MASSSYRGRLSLSDKTHPQQIRPTYATDDPPVAIGWSTEPSDITIKPQWVNREALPNDEGPTGINDQLVFEAPDPAKAPGMVTILLERMPLKSGIPTHKSPPDYTAIDDRPWPRNRNGSPRRFLRMSYTASEYGNASVAMAVLVEHDGAADIVLGNRAHKADNPVQYATRAAPKDT